MEEKTGVILGVDIGGTAVKLGMVDREGRVLTSMEQSVSFDNYRTPIMTTVVKAVDAFLQKTGMDPEGIGVSATGQIDSRKGIVAGVGGNFPGWEGAVIGPVLSERFGRKVTVANDANCMCLGEAWVGAARGYSDVIGITIGTGVGGGIITGGRLLEGARGLAGEIGHMEVHAGDGIPCGCGARGCYEKYASTTALVEAAKELDPELGNGRVIFERAENGDQKVQDLISRWIDEIVYGLMSLVYIFNPQIIVIGGGVSAQEELLIRPIREKILSKSMPAMREGLAVKAAALRNDAGLVGGVRYFLDHA